MMRIFEYLDALLKLISFLLYILVYPSELHVPLIRLRRLIRLVIRICVLEWTGTEVSLLS